MKNSIFCNNCGNYGHVFYQCKRPITSIGIIAFRKNSEDKYIGMTLLDENDISVPAWKKVHIS